jgi:hypothetical protein
MRAIINPAAMQQPGRSSNGIETWNGMCLIFEKATLNTHAPRPCVVKRMTEIFAKKKERMTESTVFYRRKVTVSELVIMFAVRVKKGVVRFPLLANKVRTELSCVLCTYARRNC